jgi:hypothetical protein
VVCSSDLLPSVCHNWNVVLPSVLAKPVTLGD